MKQNEENELNKIEKVVLFFTHTICICVLAFCMWRSEELFSEVSVIAGDSQEQNEDNLEATPTEKPTQPAEAAKNETDNEMDSESGEKSELIEDKMKEETDDEIPDQTEPASSGDAQTGETENCAQPDNPADENNRTEGNSLYRELRAEVEQKIAQGVYQELDNTQHDWWFRRKNDHAPSGSGEEIPISPYDAFYRNKNVTDEDKVIYLTFDCGYENGFTPTLLNILEKHNAQAMFFVTKSFIKTCPDYVIRMKEEGHLVGNHTLNHPVMPKEDETKLLNEIVGCAELFYETTGYEIDPFLRPPTGAYSERTLALTKDLGYSTVFWSIAYKDYDPQNQPGKEYVIDHFATYYHNGAIPLIHNISQSNTEALDDVLTMLEEAGYRFGSLTELNAAQ